MNAVAYMRHSSHSQSDTSIDGQRKVIAEFAERNGYEIIREYIDRALTGTNDKRPEFQKMLADSARRKYEVLLVYSLDRFSRNRFESATHKAHLKKHGVRVISATENISDDPAGIMVEGVLESMAEYYSAELSQKVKRGIALSVEQCKFIGGFVPLGFTVDENKRYQLDPLTAPVVQKCFELYAAGNSLTQTNKIIADRFGKEYFGNKFCSLNRILENRNYIGIYTRGGAEVKDGMPRIIDDALFERVQQMRAKKKKTPASARAHEEYLLTTKLFCGYDREMMIGVSGTSKTSAIHHYYTCRNVWRKKGCKKKNVRKNYIEDFIISKAQELLTDEYIDIIAQKVSDISKAENNTPIIAEIKRKLKDNAAAIENLMLAIERGGDNIDIISERITQKRQEKAELEKSLAREQWEKTEVDETEITFFLKKLKTGDFEDIQYKRALIAIFINKVFLYDDRATIFFSAIDRPIEVDYSLLDEMEKGDNSAEYSGSYMNATAPPRSTHDLSIKWVIAVCFFLLSISGYRFAAP